MNWFARFIADARIKRSRTVFRTFIHRPVLKLLEKILMTQAELLAELQDVKTKLVAGIAVLQAEIGKQADASPELVQAGADLEAIANALPTAPPAP